jgi:hypothetical protein
MIVIPKYIGAIDLTSDEARLVEQITLNFVTDREGHQAYLRNEKLIPQLMAELKKRNAIPQHRLDYFLNPKFRSGLPLKGSHRSLFDRTRPATDLEVYQNPSFLKYLRYFLFGAQFDHPEVIERFRSAVTSKMLPINGSDALELAKTGKDLANQYRLEPHSAGEEFFKLCLDCGIHRLHAIPVRDIVRKMKLRKTH